MFKGLLLIGMLGIASACEKSECTKVFTMTGTITDGSSTPIAGAEVTFVSHYGSSRVVTTTQTDGSYAYEWGPYVGLGNSYLIFNKNGYQAVNTQSNPLGDGDGSCNDQTIVRDAVMTP